MATLDYARSILERAAQREEEWLAGDWDSRSARGLDTMYRHRARLDSLTAALTQVVSDRCIYCNRDYPRLAVQSHHHYEPAPAPCPHGWTGSHCAKSPINLAATV